MLTKKKVPYNESERQYAENIWPWDKSNVLLDTLPNATTKTWSDHEVRSQRILSTALNAHMRRGSYHEDPRYVQTKAPVLRPKRIWALVFSISVFLFVLTSKRFYFTFLHYLAHLKLWSTTLLSRQNLGNWFESVVKLPNLHNFLEHLVHDLCTSLSCLAWTVVENILSNI